jgi:hypothetical protein
MDLFALVHTITCMLSGGSRFFKTGRIWDEIIEKLLYLGLIGELLLQE